MPKHKTNALRSALSSLGSELERTLETQMKYTGIPTPIPEYRFHKKRKWRFDFAWPHENIMLAVEIEGGTWSGKSRHTSGKGFEEDCKKYNTAALMGWKVLRFTSTMITSGEAVKVIEEFFKNGKPIHETTKH